MPRNSVAKTSVPVKKAKLNNGKSKTTSEKSSERLPNGDTLSPDADAAMTDLVVDTSATTNISVPVTGDSQVFNAVLGRTVNMDCSVLAKPVKSSKEMSEEDLLQWKTEVLQHLSEVSLLLTRVKNTRDDAPISPSKKPKGSRIGHKFQAPDILFKNEVKSSPVEDLSTVTDIAMDSAFYELPSFLPVNRNILLPREAYRQHARLVKIDDMKARAEAREAKAKMKVAARLTRKGAKMAQNDWYMFTEEIPSALHLLASRYTPREKQATQTNDEQHTSPHMGEFVVESDFRDDLMRHFLDLDGDEVNDFWTLLQPQLIDFNNFMPNMLPPDAIPLSEHVADEICFVCMSGIITDTNDIVFCESCEFCAHQKCLKIDEIPEHDWYCTICTRKNKAKLAQGKHDAE